MVAAGIHNQHAGKQITSKIIVVNQKPMSGEVQIALSRYWLFFTNSHLFLVCKKIARYC